MRNPGYPDTERIKLLKSVSNQSRSWQEDGFNKNLLSVRHIAGLRNEVFTENKSFLRKTINTQLLLITFYTSVKSR
jgi:hypothetical protein